MRSSLHDSMDQVIDRLDAAAKAYPIKALAPKIRGDLSASKAESTLRNELNQQPGYKLGLITTVQIMAETGDLAPLDTIETLFGRTAWTIPTVENTDPVPIMAKAGRLSKEFSEVIETAARAMADGRLDRDETDQLLKEVEDLLLVCIHFKALLQQIHAQSARPPRRVK